MLSPRAIPCRMCQAAPGELCKFKGAEIPLGSILGGHEKQTPKSHRCYHWKRIADLRRIRDGSSPMARARAVPGRCRWRP